MTSNFIILLFTLLSFLSVLCGSVIFFSENTIYSVLGLVGVVFFTCINIILCWNISFICFLFIMVYIGAVAILFIFVIMFVNLRTEDSWFQLSFIKKYKLSTLFLLKVHSLLASNLFANLHSFFLYNSTVAGAKIDSNLIESLRATDYMHKIHYGFEHKALFALYNEFSGFFLVLTIVLALVMIAALHLCLTSSNFFKEKSDDDFIN